MKRYLIIPDLHWDCTEEFHPSYLVVKRFVKTFKPDGVVFLGDVLDLPYIAKFNKDKLETISGKTFQGDFDLANKELDYWCKYSGKEFIIRQGNHDERIDRVIDANPMFSGFIELEENLSYTDRGIKYYREIDPPTQLGELNLIHGWYWNIHHAKKHLEVMGGNIVYGHTHGYQVYSKKFMVHDREICAWCIGCLCDKQPEWHKGRPTKWSNMFAILYLNDNGLFNLYPVQVIKNSFIWDNHTFK